MKKTEAIALLGGTVAAAADAIGVTYQAIDKWPDELPARIADRVQAALWRIANSIPHPKASPPPFPGGVTEDAETADAAE